MDKPLKYFLLISAVFAFLIGVFVWGTWTSRMEIPVNYPIIDETDNGMLQAKRKAASTLDTFLLLYPNHADSAFVRFSFEPARNRTEHLWGKVLALDSVRVKIQLTKEDSEETNYSAVQELRIRQIEDWLIHLDNGTIRGGFTAQELLRKEKEKPQSNIDSLEAQLRKFKDVFQ